ncbi:MAG TPA: hypothetical protein VIK60_16290 [Vicinamibacterales bacterium]
MLCGVGEARIGLGEPLRMRGDLPPRLLDGIVEYLKLYEIFQIRSHY